MAERNHDNHTGRTVAVVGGGTFLLWLLLRRKGWGLGGEGQGAGQGAGDGAGSPSPSTSDFSPRRCKVRIAAGGIAVDGKPASVEEAVNVCKSTEGAEVLVTGGAREGDYQDLRAAFQRAGVQTWWIEPQPRGAATAMEAMPSIAPDAVSAPVRSWVFPVPSLGDRRPEISDGWGSLRTLPDGTIIKHLGADIMFRRRSPRELLAVYKPGTANGERWFFPSARQNWSASARENRPG